MPLHCGPLYEGGTSPQLSDVFRLYCGLQAGQRVRDMCMMQDLRTMNVDERWEAWTYIWYANTCTCSSSFFRKVTTLGVLCCVVLLLFCLYGLAFFFLPSYCISH